MTHELYWIIPLCLILGLLFRRYIGSLVFLLVIGLWFGGKYIFGFPGRILLFVWKIISFPIRVVWCWTAGYQGIDYAMGVQWKRDKSVFCAKWFVTVVACLLYVKGWFLLYHLLLHK